MKVFNTQQIRQIDAFTINHEPIPSVDLMERAAGACTTWFLNHFNLPVSLHVFTGPGNNGGDGLAMARQLADRDVREIYVYCLQMGRGNSADSAINRQRLEVQGKVKIKDIFTERDFPRLTQRDLIVDALFGTGLSRSPEGLPAALISHLNASEGRIISIDIPSGLRGEGDTDITDGVVVKASDTLSFEFPKRAFFFAENEPFVGNWHVLPIGLHPKIIADTDTPYQWITPENLTVLNRPRKRFSHKGTYGHALLIAGSYGMMGAAILAARACLRSGVGLLTTHVPRAAYPIIQAAVPESIFYLDPAESIFSEVQDTKGFSAIGIGPGLGRHPESRHALENMVLSAASPLVIDADALNMLAEIPALLEKLPGNTILTPHPGEFDRLAGPSVNGYARNQKQLEFAARYGVVVILKGHSSSIAMPDGKCFYNSTGNPGMATAGSGDVLTGIILALLAQRYTPAEAALAGTYIHGLAGDIAATGTGQKALIASDIIQSLGPAFSKFEKYEKKS